MRQGHITLATLNTTQSVKDERFAFIRGIVYVSETRIARLFVRIPYHTRAQGAFKQCKFTYRRIKRSISIINIE